MIECETVAEVFSRADREQKTFYCELQATPEKGRADLRAFHERHPDLVLSLAGTRPSLRAYTQAADFGGFINARYRLDRQFPVGRIRVSAYRRK